MHEVQQAFTYLIEKTKRLPILNETQKEILLKDLNYFLTQAKCDLDRRHKTAVLSNKWKEFVNKAHRFPILKEPKAFLNVISEFTGQLTFEDKKEIEKFNKMELEQFFEDLLHEYAERESWFSENERTTVFLGLSLLLSETKIPKAKRNQKNLLKTWRLIKPILTKYGLFYKYSGATGLSSKIRMFLTGTL